MAALQPGGALDDVHDLPRRMLLAGMADGARALAPGVTVQG